MKVGKNLSGNDVMSVVGSFLSGGVFLKDDYEDRLVDNTMGKFGGVDTAMANDTGFYETAVQNEKYNAGRMIIVEQYETREEAKKGHKEWVKELKSKPDAFRDIFSGEIFKRELN